MTKAAVNQFVNLSRCLDRVRDKSLSLQCLIPRVLTFTHIRRRLRSHISSSHHMVSTLTSVIMRMPPPASHPSHKPNETMLTKIRISIWITLTQYKMCKLLVRRSEAGLIKQEKLKADMTYNKHNHNSMCLVAPFPISSQTPASCLSILTGWRKNRNSTVTTYLLSKLPSLPEDRVDTKTIEMRALALAVPSESTKTDMKECRVQLDLPEQLVKTVFQLTSQEDPAQST